MQVDTIDPVAGVTVLEGGRTRQGPRVIEVSVNTGLYEIYFATHKVLHTTHRAAFKGAGYLLYFSLPDFYLRILLQFPPTF